MIGVAMLGLQAFSMLSGAGSTAKSSRYQLSANRAAIGDINQALGDLDSTALARQEVAEEDADVEFTQQAEQTSTMFDDLQRTSDDASGKAGFAFQGEVTENFERMEKRMQDNFGVSKDNMDRNLEKTVASIEEWKLGEGERLNSEKRKLEYANDRLSSTSSIFGALGFG